MSVLDYVKDIMQAEGITQSDLAKKTKWSRQRVFDILKRDNSNFNSVQSIMNALGREVVIQRKDGKEPDFDMDELRRTIKQEAPLYGKLEAILSSMGYEIVFLKK